MLKVDKICGGYGGGIIINDLSFDINSGKILGICGRNGVGKTTLIRLISGELPVSKGKIFFLNKPPDMTSINSLSINERHELGLGIMSQEGLVFNTLTVKENLNLTSNIDFDKLDELYEYFPVLKKRYNVKTGVLSGGEKKILAFVRTMSEKNRLICLDEPSEGMAQENIDVMAQFINKYKKNGVSFLVCEQNITFQLQIADIFVILDKGMQKFSKTKDDTNYEELISYIHI